jgi:long-chain acyl-CoA synthetase
MEQRSTISEVLSDMQKGYQNPHALNEYVNGQWISISTQEMLQQIKEIALGLNALGVKKGQNIAILAYSSAHWTMVDIAIIIAGGVSVPVFPNISEENLVFEIEQTDAKTVFLGPEVADNIFNAHRKLFKKVICMNGMPSEANEISLDQLREMGRQKMQKEPKKYQELLDSLKPDDRGTIIYTSGSTGIPKAAEITQKGMMAMVPFKGFDWQPQTDRYLNILPLAHIFGRMLNICLVAWGASVYYLNDVKMIPAACQMIHPTILVVVPRLLEKIYAKMLAKVDHAGFLKKAIGHWAFDLANDEHDNSLYKQLLHPIADKIVYGTLREAFGGSVRAIISGGAPLDKHLAHFYNDVGLQIYEGWGMTEASTITVNIPGQRKIGTVGKPMPHMEIKIEADGEVLVKGPIVMKGYYKNEEMNKESFDKEGWLKTGDKGFIDSDGYLTLIGRIKEMLKTSTGEYVVPVPIEKAIAKAPLVDMAMVVAERRKYTTCLLFPDLEVLHKLKESQGYSTMSDEEFLKTPYIRDEMQKVIDQVNLHLNKAEKILDFRFISHSPTIERGELTPSMKIRREAVEDMYADLINSMYPEEETI